MNLSKNLIFETLLASRPDQLVSGSSSLITSVRVNFVANVPNPAFNMQILSAKLKKFKVKF